MGDRVVLSDHFFPFGCCADCCATTFRSHTASVVLPISGGLLYRFMSLPARNTSWMTVIVSALSLCLVAVLFEMGRPARAAGPTDGAQFKPIAPYRLVDTNSGVGGSSARLGAGQWRDYQILGIGGVPASGVSAVVVDVAAVSLIDSSASTLRVYPSDASLPDPTVLRIEEGYRPRSNTVVTKVASNGKIRVYNSNGAVHFNLDVQGYFTTSQDGSGFKAINPVRLVSTDDGTGLPAAELGAGVTRDVQITGEQVPVGATAVFANVKVSGAEVAHGLRLGEGGVSSTGPASINYQPGVYADSGMTIKLSADGRMRISNLADSGNVAVRVDVQGYFLPAEQIEGGYYNPLNGARIYDTANGTAIPAGGTRTVTVTGVGGVPAASEVSAVALTVFAGDWTSAGHVAVFPADAEEPTASSLSFNGNSSASIGLSSTSIIATSGSGAVKIVNRSSGPVRVLLNAQGWFTKAPFDPVVRELMTLSGDTTEVDTVSAINEFVAATDGELTFDQAKQALLDDWKRSAAEVQAAINAPAEPAEVDPGEDDYDPADDVDPNSAQRSTARTGDGGRINLPRAKRIGDIAIAPNKTSRLPHGHAAIFVNRDYIAQAIGKGYRASMWHHDDDGAKTFAPGAKMMSVYTDQGNGPLLSREKRRLAARWAKTRSPREDGDKYRDWKSPNAFRVTAAVGSDAGRQNCSQMVWGAYNYANGYDFNPQDYNKFAKPTAYLADAKYVHPFEITAAPQTKVYRTVS